jgi:hypothetical protein
MAARGGPTRSPGRPRRFDPETELRLIVDAAKKLLRDNDYEAASVGAILDESGLDALLLPTLRFERRVAHRHVPAQCRANG